LQFQFLNVNKNPLNQEMDQFYLKQVQDAASKTREDGD
jgi:hypothetical protein